jgi:hypothetical protein
LGVPALCDWPVLTRPRLAAFDALAEGGSKPFPIARRQTMRRAIVGADALFDESAFPLRARIVRPGASALRVQPHYAGREQRASECAALLVETSKAANRAARAAACSLLVLDAVPRSRTRVQESAVAIDGYATAKIAIAVMHIAPT